MSEILRKLREQLAAAEARLSVAMAEETMTEERQSAAFADLDLRNQLRDRVVDEAAREGKIAADAAAHRDAPTRVETGSATITREPRTYTADARGAGQTSFFHDVYAAKFLGDPAATQRLGRHMAEERAERDATQFRDVGTAAFAGLTVPQYLVDMAAPLARAGRPFANNCCTTLPLPPDGMTFNISRTTTGSSTAIQAAENDAVSETDIDDTLLTINVRTVAGQQDLSRQVVERSTGADVLTTRDLLASYHTTLDSQILNGAGSSGTHLGLRSTTSIIAVTYTDATPTAAEAWPKLWDLQSQVQGGMFLGISHLVMHPRRWGWFQSSIGTSFPLLAAGNRVTVQGGGIYTRQYGGVVGDIAGAPVVVDANVPTNLGTGTNEDLIIGVTVEESILWEDPAAPVFIRADDVGSGNLTVKFVAYGYSAYTAGRYPGAHGTIGGTGLVTPTF